MVQKFDERLDYKELKVESGGVTLQEGRDYTIEKTGQTVTVKMTPEDVYKRQPLITIDSFVNKF